MHVHSILTVKGTAVATISPSATLAEATAALRDHGVGALVVSADGSTIVGIVSNAMSFGHSPLTAARHSDVTSRRRCRPASRRVAPTTPSTSLMEDMTEKRIRHVPVVDDAGALAGIISIGDVVKARVGQLEIENNQLADYIQATVTRQSRAPTTSTSTPRAGEIGLDRGEQPAGNGPDAGDSSNVDGQ